MNVYYYYIGSCQFSKHTKVQEGALHKEVGKLSESDCISVPNIIHLPAEEDVAGRECAGEKIE